MTALVPRFGDVYRAHMAREESELFPAARAALPPDVLEALAAEMLGRRR